MPYKYCIDVNWFCTYRVITGLNNWNATVYVKKKWIKQTYLIPSWSVSYLLDYSRAGYRMIAVTNAGLHRRTAWRYTVVIMVMSLLAPLIGVSSMWFAVETLQF